MRTQLQWPTIDFAGLPVAPYGHEDTRNRRHAVEARCTVCLGPDDLTLVGDVFVCFWHRGAA